jgi:hypothetical protein
MLSFLVLRAISGNSHGFVLVLLITIPSARCVYAASILGKALDILELRAVFLIIFLLLIDDIIELLLLLLSFSEL